METQNIGTQKVEEFNIEELAFDKDIYPRTFVDKRSVAYAYAQKMRAGEIFPPITVGKYKRKLYVIDGMHRIEANKLLGVKKIEGILKHYEDKDSMFVDSVMFNITHGKRIEKNELVRIIYKLKKMGHKDRKISEITKVPIDKIDVFLNRAIVTDEGKVVYTKELLYSSMKKQHFTEEEIQTTVKRVNQKYFSARSVNSLLKQLIEITKNDLLPLHEDDTKELTLELYEALKERLEL